MLACAIIFLILFALYGLAAVALLNSIHDEIILIRKQRQL